MKSRAFTLIEVAVALAIGSVIAAAALLTLLNAHSAQQNAVAKAALARDAELVFDIIGKDITAMGVGVPRGDRIDVPDFVGTREDHQLRPLIRIGKPDNIVFLGDLPYPNADLNGIVTVADVGGGAALNHLDVTSEISPCVPSAGGATSYQCDNTTATLLTGPSGGVFGAGDICDAGHPSSRLCPWALNKWESGSHHVHLVVGAVDGGWYEREWNGSATATDGPYLGIALSNGAGSGNTFNSGGAPAVQLDEMFQKNAGGYAATVDRVFWSLEDSATPGNACPAGSTDCVLLRRQCWGRIVDPGAANFPKVGNGNFRSTATPTDCAPPTDGTGWETVMTGVSAFTLTYNDESGTSITGTWDLDSAAKVASVDVSLALSRKVSGSVQTSDFQMKKRFYIDNFGGLIDNAGAAAAPAGHAPHPGGHGHGGCGFLGFLFGCGHHFGFFSHGGHHGGHH